MKKIFPILLCGLILWGVNVALHAELGLGENAGTMAISRDYDRIAYTGGLLIYALSAQRGFLVSIDGGTSWQPRNQGLPTKMVFPFQEAKPRRLTAMGFDPLRPERVAVSTANMLFLSDNAGQAWRAVPLPRPLFSRSSYITAVALSPGNPERIFIGTSFEGVFFSKDGGGSWARMEEGLRFLYWGVGFWEEIAGLACHPGNPELLLISGGFGHGLYRYDLHKFIAEPVEMTGVDSRTTIRMISFRPENLSDDPRNTQKWRMDLDTGEQILSWTENNKEWTHLASREPKPEDPVKAERLKQASSRYGVYMPAYYAQGKRLDGQIAQIKKMGLNAIVVDCKDDSGNLTYDSNLALAKKIGAVRPLFNLDELVKKTKANQVYLIARVVVFKDERLYNYDKFRYALWDKTSNQPWRNLIKHVDAKTKKTTYTQGEYWVDGFSGEVWDYNLAIVEELQARGVDEIQFDYIRFPTDGPLARIRYRYMTEGMEKVDALESFLSLARKQLTIPISTDLYGFNCWCRMDGWNGQNLELISEYIDAVCPMFYPSHFPSRFMPGVEYLDRAKRIYQEGSQRAIDITGGRCLVRPYVQAFLLGGERKMNSVSYERYLANQINGAKAGGANGFTLWNARNSYYMMIKPLAAEGTYPLP